MREIAVQDLSLREFQRFGVFANLVNPTGNKIGEEPTPFFPDQVVVRMGAGAGTEPAVSVCRVSPRPAVIDVSEYHTATGEGILPLDGDVVIHVGLPTMGGELPSEFRAFRVPRLTQVALNPGVWHHAPFALGEGVVHVQILLPERTYDIDCQAVPLKGDRQVTLRV